MDGAAAPLNLKWASRKAPFRVPIPVLLHNKRTGSVRAIKRLLLLSAIVLIFGPRLVQVPKEESRDVSNCTKWTRPGLHIGLLNCAIAAEPYPAPCRLHSLDIMTLHSTLSNCFYDFQTCPQSLNWSSQKFTRQWAFRVTELG